MIHLLLSLCCAVEQPALLVVLVRLYPSVAILPPTFQLAPPVHAMVRNRALVYVQHPDKGIEPAKHFKLSDGEIDLDGVALNGGVLLKMLSFSLDPYLRHKMIEKEQRPYERIVSPPRSGHGRYT